MKHQSATVLGIFDAKLDALPRRSHWRVGGRISKASLLLRLVHGLRDQQHITASGYKTDADGTYVLDAGGPIRCVVRSRSSRACCSPHPIPALS
ncbi:MAG: hypothetical protein ACLVJ6_13750 [Merdibacter sp.]